MSANNQPPTLPVVVGITGATQITADIGNTLKVGQPTKVLLTANYTTFNVPGYPNRPGFMGSALPNDAQTISSGATLTLLKPEADALVTAGGATYV